MTDQMHTHTPDQASADAALSSHIARLQRSRWSVSSRSTYSATMYRPGRPVLPFRLATPRGILLCVLSVGIAFSLWLMVAACYSWWAKMLPMHRQQIMTIEVVQDESGTWTAQTVQT